MATVYRAQDLRHERAVAIKVLHPELAAALGPERFLREIKITAALHHPHILPLLDSGQVDGLLFYVMPLARGESLRQRLHRTGPLPIDEALAIGRDVAHALQHAHEQGVLHRDVKPENVLLEDGLAIVADFGIARAVSDAGGEKLTETGLAVGTPQYMSPEQATAERAIDHRTDIYSLGCVLYELLAGEPPFSGTSAQSVIRQHIAAEPRALTVLRPAVPPATAAAIARALAKDPVDRYPTATAFAEALASGSTPATLTPAQPLRRPARAWVQAAGMTGLLAIAVAGAWLVFGGRGGGSAAATLDRRTVAVLPFTNLSPDPENEYFAAGIQDEILSQLAKIGALTVISRTSVLQYQGTTKDVRTIGMELGAGALLEGSVRRAGDRVRITVQLIDAVKDAHLWTEQYEDELTVANVFVVQADIASNIAAALEAELTAGERARLAEVPTQQQDAYDAYLRGVSYSERILNFRVDLENAIESFVRAAALDSTFALAYAELSRAHAGLYHQGIDRSDARARLARAAVDRAFALAPELPEAQRALGYYYYAIFRDYDRAREQLRRAKQGLPGDYDVTLIESYIAKRQGRFDDARAGLERATAMNPRSIAPRYEIAITYREQRRYAESDRALRAALNLEPDNNDLRMELARIPFVSAGDVVPIRRYLDSVSTALDNARDRPVLRWQIAYWSHDFAAARNVLEASDIQVVEGQTMLRPKSLYVALTLLAAGDLAAARAAFDSAIAFYRLRLATNPDDARVHAGLGLALAGLVATPRPCARVGVRSTSRRRRPMSSTRPTTNSPSPGFWRCRTPETRPSTPWRSTSPDPANGRPRRSLEIPCSP